LVVLARERQTSTICTKLLPASSSVMKKTFLLEKNVFVHKYFIKIHFLSGTSLLCKCIPKESVKDAVFVVGFVMFLSISFST